MMNFTPEPSAYDNRDINMIPELGAYINSGMKTSPLNPNR